MRGLSKQRLMISNAIQRVLNREMDRAMIGSLADLRRMYEAELAANRAEIEAYAATVVGRMRAIDARLIGRTLRCIVCDELIPDAKRLSRCYCSARCRQRAHRQAGMDLDGEGT